MARRTLALTSVLLAAGACALAWALLRGEAPPSEPAAPPPLRAHTPEGEPHRPAALAAGAVQHPPSERVGLGAASTSDAPSETAPAASAAAPAAPSAAATAGGISGRVVDDQGRPLAAFQVTAVPRGDARAGSKNENIAVQVASPDGAFLVPGVAPGRWRVVASAPDHVEVEAAPEVDIPTPEPVTIVLHRAASLAGTVVDPAGLPVAEARVAAGFLSAGFVPHLRQEQSAVCAADGRFELHTLVPGRHTVLAEREGWAPSEALEADLAPGARVEGLVIVLRAGGLLTGEVVRAGRPAAEHRVLALADHGALTDDGVRHAETDANGRFAIEHLAAGPYQLLVLRDGEGPPLRSADAEVRDGETTHVVVDLDAGGVRVRGRVTRGGRPFDDSNLLAIGEGGPLLRSLAQAELDEDGRYELALQAPGRYTLLFDRIRHEVQVAIPDVPEHALDIELPSGRIAGRVVGPQGALSEARVTLVREDGATLLAHLDGPAHATTDESGRYAFEGLPAGLYTATAAGEGALGAQAQSGLALPADGSLEGVDFALERGGALRGIVRGSDGRAAPDAMLIVRDAGGAPLVTRRPESTNLQGRYALESLPAGTITVEARTRGEASLPLVVRIEAGETRELALELRPAALVRVALRDTRGAPLAAAVSVRDAAGREHAWLAGSADAERLMREGVSASERAVGPLPPGLYRIAARAPDGRHAARDVEVEGGGELAVELVLQ